VIHLTVLLCLVIPSSQAIPLTGAGEVIFFDQEIIVGCLQELADHSQAISSEIFFLSLQFHQHDFTDVRVKRASTT
jgi:hypothetical protein